MLLRICFNFLQEYPLGYRGYVMFLEHFHNNVSKTKELIGTFRRKEAKTHMHTLLVNFYRGPTEGIETGHITQWVTPQFNINTPFFKIDVAQWTQM